MTTTEGSATKRERSRVNLLSAPGLVVVIIVTQVPFLATMILSLFSWNIRQPALPIRFLGLGNYGRVGTDPTFYTALSNTLVLTAGALVLSTVLGFALALAFADKFPGSGLARSILIMPYFVMEPVVGIVWKTLILSPSFGLAAVLARALGLPPISFFGADTALLTIIVLVTWQWTPFIFLILLSGLQSLPEEVMESARLDGAGFWRLVFSFKIPLIMPYIKVATMFGLINILKVFGIIFVTTQGGPGVASSTLPYYIYNAGFYQWQVGLAATTSVIVVVITLVLINIFFRFQGDVTKRA